MNPVAKNLNKFNKPATHKDKKQAMKRGEQKHKGKAMQFEAEKDSGSDLAKIGRILMDKAVTQKDENLSNVMARLGNELTMYGTNTGARTPEQLEDRAELPMEMIEKLVDYASKFADDPAIKSQDAEDMLDDEEEDDFGDDEEKIVDVGDADEDDEETKEALGDNKKKGIAVMQMLDAIVRDKQAKDVKFMDGKSKVDMFTASAVTKVFDALNDQNQKKVLDMIGTRGGFMKIADFAMSKVGESVEEGHNDYDPGDDGDYAEREMAEGQLEFIKYACDELEKHFDNFPMPEWFQNKLARVHGTMMTLHAYIEGKEGKYGLNDESVEETRCDECGLPRFTALPEHIQETYETIAEGKKKGVDGKVCWKGYKRMGTKKKGGKTVDNCVKMTAKEKNK